MQALWSRSARTTSCRCSACLHSVTTTLARRTTTAAPRRKTKFGDIFTMFYSSIFATAALADAKLKDNRRKQWDLAIAEVKASIDGASSEHGAVEGNLYTQSSALEKKASQMKGLISNSHQDIRQLLPNSTLWNGIDTQPTRRSRVEPLEKQLQLLDSHLRQSFASRGVDTVNMDEIGTHKDEDAHLPAQDWTNEQPSSELRRPLRDSSSLDKLEAKNLGESNAGASLARREAKTNTQLVMTEKMVAELVTQLLLNTKALSTKDGSIGVCVGDNPSLQGNFGRDILDNVVPESRRLSEHWKILQAGRMKMARTQLPSYTGLTCEWTTERSALHRALESIFSSKSSKGKITDSMIAKVCYNLLISSAPPNIDTYNLMIENFTKLNDHSSAQIVIFSFFNRSKLPANERTVVAVLEHYALTKDSRGFRDTIRRMRAVDGDFRLRRRRQEDLHSAKDQSWALTHKLNLRHGYFHEKVQRTPKIFESLIYGAWEMFGLSKALMYFKASVIEGQPVSGGLFVDLVKGCLAHSSQSDWMSLKLLRNFLCYWRHGSYAPNHITSDPVARKHLQLLMRKVGIDPPGRLQQVGWLPEPSHWLSVRALRDCFNDMMRQIYLEHLEEMLTTSLRLLSEVKTVIDESRISLTVIYHVDESSSSTSHPSRVDMERRINRIGCSIAGLGARIATGRLDPGLDYVQILADYDLAPVFTTTTTMTPQGKRFACTVTIEGASEVFGSSLDLFYSKTLAEQYASMRALEWLDGGVFVAADEPNKMENSLPNNNVLDVINDGWPSLDTDFGEMMPASEGLPRRSFGMDWRTAKGDAIMVPAAGELDSREHGVGASFSPLYAKAVKRLTPIVRSSKRESNPRLQPPTRPFQVIEYRPRLAGFPIFDRPTSHYAKAGE